MKKLKNLPVYMYRARDRGQGISLARMNMIPSNFQRKQNQKNFLAV